MKLFKNLKLKVVAIAFLAATTLSMVSVPSASALTACGQDGWATPSRSGPVNGIKREVFYKSISGGKERHCVKAIRSGAVGNICVTLYDTNRNGAVGRCSTSSNVWVTRDVSSPYRTCGYLQSKTSSSGSWKYWNVWINTTSCPGLDRQMPS